MSHRANLLEITHFRAESSEKIEAYHSYASQSIKDLIQINFPGSKLMKFFTRPFQAVTNDSLIVRTISIAEFFLELSHISL